MLHWANTRYSIFCMLDNHQHVSEYNTSECMLAVGCVDSFSTADQSLELFTTFQQRNNDWLFGHINYDCKNLLHPKLVSKNINKTGFPDLFFFRPEIVLELSNNEIKISSHKIAPFDILNEIQKELIVVSTAKNSAEIKERTNKDTYLEIIRKIKQHIQLGDCYELNFCQEFFSSNASIEPLMTYHQLTHISPTPFAGFYKLNDKYLLCASPERFIKKAGSKIISQPMKGTVRRNQENKVEDEKLKEYLKKNNKERIENVMIVDLVRNDLSRVCTEGSVHVEELFGVQSFSQVHQMVSTVVGNLDESKSFINILQSCFPMGSMTGAPKKKVMELIEVYEPVSRGVFSGCLGYIAPTGDFDFNVIIRSIVYNSTVKYLSYHVGGGITSNSTPEQEYEECMLKARAMQQVLS